MGWTTGSGWQGTAVVPGTLTVGDAVVVSSATQSGSAAFQAGNFDFNVGAGYGSSTATAPVYGAGVMGNIIGAALTATQNILAGVIGKYTVTTSNSSVLGKAGVIGEVGNLANSADAAVLAVLGGDTGTTTPGAAFGVMSINSTAASQFGFGLDLYRAAVGSYQPVTYGTAAIRLPNASWIMGRNAADSANVNMLRLNTSNQVVVGSPAVITLADGSWGAPSLGFAADGYIGLWASGADIYLSAGVTGITYLGGTNGATSRWKIDSAHLVPVNDAFANVGSQAVRVSEVFTQISSISGTNGAKISGTYTTTTVDTTNLAASITATNLIPAGSMVYAVVTRNTAVFNGTMTSFDIGDGTTVDLFANNTTLASGDTTDLTDHATTFQPTLYTAATNVVVTAVGGTFGTTGTIRITVFYYKSTAPTS